jgi:exosome complex component RRP4
MHVNAAVDEFVDHDDDISQWYDMGDAIVAKVTGVTKGKDVKLSMESRNAQKLDGGRIVTVPPSTVPRIIGRKGTMVGMIKDHTDTEIIIGQNGRVWIDGDDIDTAARAVNKVADEAHTENLTDRMEEWLQNNGGGQQ